MMYTLVYKHRGKWHCYYSDPCLDMVKRQREWLLNHEYPPMCYIIKTQPEVEDIQETVGRFIHAVDLVPNN